MPGTYRAPRPRRRSANGLTLLLLGVILLGVAAIGVCLAIKDSRGNASQSGKTQNPASSAALAAPSGGATKRSAASASPAAAFASALPSPGAPSPAPSGEDAGIFTNGGVVVKMDQLLYQSADLYVKITNTNDGNGQNYYVADCRMKDSGRLFSASASGDFAPHKEDKTSNMARQHGSVIAVNGDYFGASAQDRADRGIVIRNGKLYRSTPWYDVAAVFPDGTMKTFDKSEITADQLMSQSCMQAWSFGPMLLDGDGKVFPQDQLKARAPLNNPANPRTGIGYIDPNHFVLVVVDGTRTAGSGYKGMTRLQFAQLFQSLGCKSAYGLDGGGSSVMVFMGKVISHPADPSGERSVSDIIYFGESETDPATAARYGQ